MEKLALFGGTPVKTTPYGTGKRFGSEELEQLREALEQNTLFYWAGNKVKTLTKKFAEMYGALGCVAASSGTAAIHVALGAVGVGPGDEVITAPITDMGTLVGILFQNAVPVFADLDPHTYNLDPASVEAKVTDRTKAILVVHLAGNPADMDPILEIAKKHKIKVIEDCAQSYLTYYKGKLVGTIGDIGCFSLNDFKQISAGDGGLVLTNNEEYLQKAARFADKNYNRIAPVGVGNQNNPLRDVPFLAPNYRMNELTGAVGIAQLNRLAAACSRRNVFGEMITEGIKDLPGVCPPKITEGGKSSYWFYLLRINEKEAGADRDEFAEALKAEGIACGKGYIPSCIYEYGLLKDKNVYEGKGCPFDCKYYPQEITYQKGLCPHAEEIIETSIKLPVDEFLTDDDARDIIAAFRKVSAYFAARKESKN